MIFLCWQYFSVLRMGQVLAFLAESDIPSSIIRLQHQQCLHIIYSKAANLRTKFRSHNAFWQGENHKRQT